MGVIASAGRTGRVQALQTSNVVPWLPIAVVSFAGFALVTAMVLQATTVPFDEPLLRAARDAAIDAGFWNLVSEASNWPLILVAISIVGWLLMTKQTREALFVFLVLAAATAGSETVKELVARPRPVDTEVLAGVVYSYPSGHILEAITIYGIITLKFWHSRLSRTVRVSVAMMAIAFVALVGVARMALGAHYPSDVLGGALAGVGVLASYASLSDRSAADRGQVRVGAHPG
jgi:undecaprenyl-diphosphatase